MLPTPVEEILPQRLGVGVCHRVVKGAQLAVMAAEVCFDQGQHLLGDGIRRKAQGEGFHIVGQGLAVFRIKVPGTANRAAVAIEQQSTLRRISR